MLVWHMATAPPAETSLSAGELGAFTLKITIGRSVVSDVVVYCSGWLLIVSASFPCTVSYLLVCIDGHRWFLLHSVPAPFSSVRLLLSLTVCPVLSM